MKIILLLFISLNITAVNLHSDKYTEGIGSNWCSDIELDTRIVFDNDIKSMRYNSFTFKSEGKPQTIITINDSISCTKSYNGVFYEYKCTTESGGFCDMVIYIKHNRYDKIKIKYSNIEKIYKIKFE